MKYEERKKHIITKYGDNYKDELIKYLEGKASLLEKFIKREKEKCN